ncbi:MAG: peptidase E [Chitinophagales bacterium]|nr:peptidase E [Chitinophagales bacterium]
MKFYLSSFGYGNSIEKLKQMIPSNNRLGYIFNAKDFVGSDADYTAQHLKEEITFLNSLGFQAEALDLKDYFGKKDTLQNKLNELGAIWVCGGNTFVLRQAMFLSGFDTLFESLKNRKEFLWGGYSAGICILQTSLKTIENVDDPFNFPYKGIDKPIYEGLKHFPFSFMPHYDSDHFESEEIGKEIQRCIANKDLFIALRDGDVIIYEE